MIAHGPGSLIPLVLLAVAGPLAACSDPVAIAPISADDLTMASAKTPPSGAPLEVRTEYKVESLNPGSIRELLEITVYFSGVDPVDPESGLPMENVELSFERPSFEYEQPVKSELKASVSAEWQVSKRGEGFEFEATDPQAVLDAVKVEVFESGQAVAVVTDYVAAAEGRLTFNSNLKLWELRLGFAGVITPTDIVTPTMLKTIAGSAGATLRIGSNQVTTRIRENEVSYASAQMVLEAETKIEDQGPDALRELLGILARFTGPNPFAAQVDYLKLDFEINFTGIGEPPSIRVMIPRDAWLEREGGQVYVIDHQPQWLPPGVKVVVVQNGQILADLTDEIASFAGDLRFDLSTKTWELRLEIAGIVIPSDSHIPLLVPIAAARLAKMGIGTGTESLTAFHRRSEATF